MKNIYVKAVLSPLRGLFFSPCTTHGLRRGLYYCAASRLNQTCFSWTYLVNAAELNLLS
jgi:hypothetical protein